MKYGLSEKQLNEIINIIGSYPEIEEAVLFGSRAMDTYKEASDVDIALKGERVTASLAAKLKFDIEEDTYLPFFFDFVAYPTITNEALKEHIDTKGVSIFRKGWRECKLGDIVTIKHGWPFKSEFFIDSTTDKPIVIGIGNFNYLGGFRFSSTKLKCYIGDYPKEYELTPGDILLVMTCQTEGGEILGIPGIIPNDNRIYLHNQRLGKAVVTDSNLVNNKFLYWLFLTSDFNQHLVNSASGTKILHTSPSRIEEFQFSLPTLPEQRTIASVLSSIDDKIDLLHRQNKTLEAIAENLFRQWFVEEADEGWEERPLSFYGKIICGKTPSKKVQRYFNGDIPFIKIPDMHDNFFIFKTNDSLSEEGKQSQPDKTLPPRSICVSCIATVGLVSLNAKESQTNQQINSIVPYEEYYRYFLYFMMRSHKDLLNAMASGGTATLNLNTGDFSKIPVLYPGKSILKDFHEKVELIFGKIFNNQSQILTLEKLRDTLLPKLVSGKVRVKV